MLHHSDKGIQYCCNGYIELLQRHYTTATPQPPHVKGLSITTNPESFPNSVTIHQKGGMVDV
jgi:hypothetical protein